MPETLNDLENLKYLYLPRNNIEEIKNIGNLEYLKVLNLTKNKIKNLENLEKLPALRIINISSNPIDYENNGNIETLNTLEDNGVKIISDPVSGPMNTWV